MTLLPIASIHVGDRFRRDLGDLDDLVESIDRVGLLHPVVVAEQAGRVVLVAGERRLRACERLGWERIPIRMLPTIENLLEAERDENAVRLDFSPSEAVAIAAALRPIEQAAARGRQGQRTDLAPEPPANVSGGRAEDRIAAAVGMSRPTLAKAEAVVEAAAADPVLAPLVEAMDESGNVAGAHRVLQALPPEPEPEQVQAAVTAVRERRPKASLPITDAHRARFPDLAAAELSADLADAIAQVRTGKLDPKAWADRLERMTAEDIARLRQTVAHVHRWADEWDALLAPRPLSIVGGSK